MQPIELQERVLDHFHEHPHAIALLKRRRGKTCALVMQLFRDIEKSSTLPSVVLLMSRMLEASQRVLATALLHARELAYPVSDVRYRSFSVAVRGTSVLIKAVGHERNTDDNCWLYVDEICFVPLWRLQEQFACLPNIVRAIGSPKDMPAATFVENFGKNVASNPPGNDEFIAHARLVNPLPQFPLLVVPD